MFFFRADSTKNVLSPEFLKPFCGVLTVVFILLWYNLDSEAEPWSVWQGPQESTRMTTLRRVADSANQGFYYQLDPSVPMEHEWEDVGVGFMMVSWGLLKRFLGLGPLDAHTDPYRVELFVVLLPVILIFFTRLFSLPRWFWATIPLFFLWAVVPKFPLAWENIGKMNGLLYLSVSTRWVKVLSGLWTFTMTLQFFQWWREGLLLNWSWKKTLRLFIMGLVMGLFYAVRKDIWVTSGLALAFCLWLLEFVAPNYPGVPAAKAAFRKKAGIFLATLGLILAGILAVKGIVCLTWTIRDRYYSLKPVSRYYGRNTWHTLTASLGVLPNNYGVSWGDVEVSNTIKNLPENRSKGLVYGTVVYEKAARKFYFDLVRRDPGLLLRNLKHRAGQLWFDHHNGLTRSFALITLLLFLGTYQRWLGILLLSNILANTVILIFVNHWLHYGLDLVTHYRLAQMIGLGAVSWRLGEILFQRPKLTLMASFIL